MLAYTLTYLEENKLEEEEDCETVRSLKEKKKKKKNVNFNSDDR
jgi:hypothetical protein